ncbi:MAG TPA: glycerophosphodiester phosphodiesterase family protein [Croceibacterium sp.]|nr:glycerophosphodiester phosphodiesterase family protein [Croceibacterium sp.]
MHGTNAVENSPSAFRAAIAAGCGIECDVQQSSDGAAMVFHDWELDRLTDEHGPVRLRTVAGLSGVALRGGDPVWTLPRLLAEIGGRVPLLIELKSRRDVPFEPLCNAVASALSGYPGPAAVMSFDPMVVRWFGRNAPGIVRGLVVTEDGRRGAFAVPRGILALRFAHAEFIAFDVRDLPSRFAAAMRARDLPVLTWTVSGAARLATARAFADALIAEGEGLELARRDA